MTYIEELKQSATNMEKAFGASSSEDWEVLLFRDDHDASMHNLYINHTLSYASESLSDVKDGDALLSGVQSECPSCLFAIFF